MLEPAPRVGEAPRVGREQGASPLPDDQRQQVDEHWSRRHGLERQLHDGPALRIAALTLQLGLLGQKLPGSEPELQRDISRLQDQLHAVLQELRSVANQIYPPLLYEAGLGPALADLADRAWVQVQLDVQDVRFDPAVEGVAYFAVLEFLDSLGTDAAAVGVRVRRDGPDLVMEVSSIDTGRVTAVIDQIQRLGGVVEILPGTTGSGAGSPMGTIRVRTPCE